MARNKLGHFLLAVAFAAMAFTPLSCDAGNNPSAFAGKWVEENGSEVMELFKDGTGIVKEDKKPPMSISWKVADKRFVITTTVRGSQYSVASNYEISSETLTLTDDKGETTIFVREDKLEEFKAKKAAAEEAAKAAAAAERAKVVAAAKAEIAACANKDYKTVKIGNQVWMTENLNCKVSGSKCYKDDEANCNKFGRLYNWEMAMAVCPKGWHLPSKSEWHELNKAIGHKDGSFSYVGYSGYWWSASEYNSGLAYSYCRGLIEIGHDGRDKSRLFSVRCLRD